MIEKNVVILRIETGNPSGVVRYIQMLTEGMKHMNGIKVHIICLNTSLICKPPIKYPYKKESL